jgi:hypothetical protein
VAGRRCVSCGAAVGAFAERCPRCGADPDLTLIELGSHDDRPGRVWPRSPGRRRSWLRFVGAAIAAWALVVAVGTLRSSSSDRDAGQDEAASSTTTTTRPPMREKSSEVAAVEPLALGEATGLHITASNMDSLLDIDLDSGRSVEHDVGGVVLDANRLGLVVVDEGAIVWRPFPLDAATAVAIAPYSDAILEGGAWLLEDASGVWVRQADTDSYDSGATLRLLAIDGSGVVATAWLPADAWPFGVAGDHLAVAAAGRLYAIDTAGVIADLGVGSPIAAGNGYVVVTRCDEALRCGSVRVDIASRDEVPLPGLTEIVAGRLAGAWVGSAGVVLTARFGPDGALALADKNGTRALSDLGQPSFDEVWSGAFSADGRWVVIVGAREVWVGPAGGGSGLVTELPLEFQGARVILVDGPVA